MYWTMCFVGHCHQQIHLHSISTCAWALHNYTSTVFHGFGILARNFITVSEMRRQLEVCIGPCVLWSHCHQQLPTCDC